MQPLLITGGAGFVGTNVAAHFLDLGRDVLLFDNLARAGVSENYDWLRTRYGARVQLCQRDIRDAEAITQAVEAASAVFHFAAQVAVTTSLVHPLDDFEINARGTLNILEAIRQRRRGPIPLLFTSTNKVYGALEDVPTRNENGRHLPADMDIARHGISETRALDFHSPYGCSKGAADQYVVDYARTFDLPLTALRMSCIYGPHQKGTEDQGWVAHFILQALRGEPITLYGDGRQVRDLLWAPDLVEAFARGLENIDALQGRAWNIGGGPDNIASLLEIVDWIEELHGERPEVKWGDWRPGDQKFYISDTRAFGEATGWRAKTGVRAGVERLYHWLAEARRERELMVA